MEERRLAPPEHGGMTETDEVRMILDHYISGQVRWNRDGIRQVRRWLWRLWRFDAPTVDAAAAFLVGLHNRPGHGYRAGPRYETVFQTDAFLKAFYGSNTQELRPHNYISRHFGNSWMNVQKVLRQPPGRPQDPIIYRWAYHSFHIAYHGKTLEHLFVSMAIEKLAAMTGQLNGTAVVGPEGTQPLISGDVEANNALLERYRKLTDPMPHRKPRAGPPRIGLQNLIES